MHFLCKYLNILFSFISGSVLVAIKTLKYIKYKQERCLHKWQKDKMQGRTHLTKCAATRQTTIIYTSLGLSGCKSYQRVIAFDRSCSPSFTITYTGNRCNTQLKSASMPMHHTMNIKLYTPISEI
jgi:hypothetical protein